MSETSHSPARMQTEVTLILSTSCMPMENIKYPVFEVLLSGSIEVVGTLLLTDFAYLVKLS